MREVEDSLAEAPLRTPSPRLRARLEEAFGDAGMRSRRWFRLPVPLWACGLLAAVCGGLGFWGRTFLTPPPPRVVYILPVEGELRRMLTGETEGLSARDSGEWRVTVTAQRKDEL